MSKNNFFQLIRREHARLSESGLSKLPEKIISGFEFGSQSPLAIIDGKSYTIFNSNDYLGLRFHPDLIAAEHQAAQKFGVGPGAVRFISGSLSLHTELESAIASFHNRQSALIFSSAFTANFSIIPALTDSDTLIISDALNHRSIIDGIRVTNLPPDHRQIYPHLDYRHLRQILAENIGKFKKCLVISDGVFSMLGEIVDLKQLRSICDEYDDQYPDGVLLYIDDAHGVGVIGQTGRGTEEYHHQSADVLVGTFGKAFGCDGGYVVGSYDQINFLREKAAGYIYSNNLTPGTAGAALVSIKLVDSDFGRKLIQKLHVNMGLLGSKHAIFPLILGDPQKTSNLKQTLFDRGILVTSINYPVVPQGRDEIRLQLSASHTDSEIKTLLSLLNAQNS